MGMTTAVFSNAAADLAGSNTPAPGADDRGERDWGERKVDSASNDRTINNVVRHEYRILSDAEKADMKEIKDLGAALIAKIQEIQHEHWQMNPKSRQLEIAQERAEEAVMWAVKHITK